MTNSPLPDPQSSPKDPLGFDEFIGILVALSTIGSIFWWAVSQKPQSLNFISVLPPELVPATGQSPSPSPVPPAIASPSAKDPVAIVPGETAKLSTGVAAAILPIQKTQTSSKAAAAIVPPKKAQPSPKIVGAIAPGKKAQPIGKLKRSSIETLPKIVTAVPAAPAARKASTPAKQVKFSDVPANLWATPFIAALTQRGVFTGFTDKTFRPYQAMTRAEFAVRLDKAFNKKPEEAATAFEDVPNNHWAYSSIKESDMAGFMEGYPKDYFRPAKSVTRTEAIVALASGLDLKVPANPEKILQSYKDAAQIPKYARGKVAAAIQAGLVVGSNSNLLRPNQPATRAEVAAFLYQGLVKRGKVKAINSKAIVKP
ncbi:S-layer homology domain-containing protein [Planktothrix sp. FACHB-1355]|uniref:S-layer homology domain-containing protein n=1 Tax=Aerosakkonema funiforme FACHB-1375 TaxID=2949571 RepID=A0A926ZHY1_9CYAN|nr:MULTISPECIES: S-layer homology domain-containing protein [Oscillatoriales]MBD2183114.1 S-layer homology domain-containing protein [Aerosakkonema funiforme FACHB-1375]MBD3558684.1 S-layer homology domain-containing protein [Planktothrix sp. FACHB-1355]